MSRNSFGHLFRFTSWGESHGPAIGAAIDGCPPGIKLDETDIQRWLDRRRPGASAHASARKEADRVRILSGLFEGRTTGAPIALQIENRDARSKDYDALADVYRPGHADFTYQAKYGLRDHRGGGRASARETAMRVAAGAIARKVLGDGVRITGWLAELGGLGVGGAAIDPTIIAESRLSCPDPSVEERWETMLEEARAASSSLGGVVGCKAVGVPAGWGAPVYAKLDAELGGAMLSINAAKGVEIGNGFAAARLSGEENADQMEPGSDGPRFGSNKAGGVLGGISTGQPVTCRVAFKPTSSIGKPLTSVTRAGEATEVSTGGRHDPCVAIRAVPVVEAMMALVLADHFLLHRGQCG